MSTYSWSVPTSNIITGNTYIKDTDNKIQDTIDDLADFVNSSGSYAGQGLMFDYVDKASNQTITGIKTFSNGIIGNSSTTTKWSSARTITLGGDVTGSVSIDGSENVTLNISIEDDSHNHTISNVDGLQNAIDLKSNLASPSFTGTPTTPTANIGDNTQQIASTAFVMQNINPVGTIIYTASNSIPLGYLKASGQQVSRVTYANLFAAIGVTFGVGNGSTTFTLPDLRGEFVRGWDDSRGIDAGRTFGSWQADEFRSHNHTTHSHANDLYGTYIYGGGSKSGTELSGSTGGNETRPRNIALLACIKY